MSQPDERTSTPSPVPLSPLSTPPKTRLTGLVRAFASRRGLGLYRFIHWLPDWHWLNQTVHRLTHWRVHGRIPDSVADCRDLNDYWYLLKASAKTQLLGCFSDKAWVKAWISQTVGAQYVIPSLHVTADASTLERFSWPYAYVLKPNHLSQAVLFKPTGGPLTNTERAQCQQWLKRSLFRETREYQYRLITPQLLVEPLLTFQGGSAPELKCYVLNGRVVFLKLVRDRHHNHRVQLYNRDWVLLSVSDGNPTDPEPWPQPTLFADALQLAESLGALFPIVRVDLYLTDDGVKFGELTFTPCNAVQQYQPSTFLSDLWATVDKTTLSNMF